MQKVNSIRPRFFWFIIVWVIIISCTRKTIPVQSQSEDYLPATSGSYWNYIGDVAETKKINANTKLFGKRIYHEGETTYNGKMTVGYISRENGNYYSRGFLGAAGDTLELIILKDNVPTGTSWNTTLQTSMLPIAYKFTIDAKGIRTMVNGKLYENVIKEKMEVSFVVDSGLKPITTEFIYFAPGIGIIQFQTVSNSGSVKYSNLDTYHIN